MSYYVASDAVDVFPFSKNRGDFGSKNFSEQNILKITKNYLLNESYVISCEEFTDDKSFTIEFVLGGYYFKLTKITPTEKALFAVIYIDPVTNQLLGSDVTSGETSEFTGLQLVTNISDAVNPVDATNISDSEKQSIKKITLQLLNDNHVVPLESKPSVEGVVDGGVIE